MNGRPDSESGGDVGAAAPSDRSGQPDQYDQADQAGHFCQSGQPGQSGQKGAQPAVRCFVGLPLPQEWQDRLAVLRDHLPAPGRTPADDRQPALADLLRRLRWTHPGNWHLTLRFLGNVPAPRIPELATALAQVAFAPFTLAVGRAGAFPARGAPRVVWLGLARGAKECASLAASVDAVLAPLGFAPESRPFAPHLTLARVHEARSDDRPENGSPESGRQKHALRDKARHGARHGARPDDASAFAAFPQVADTRAALLAVIDAGIARAASPWPACMVREMVLWRSDLGGPHPAYTPLAVLPTRG